MRKVTAICFILLALFLGQSAYSQKEGEFDFTETSDNLSYYLLYLNQKDSLPDNVIKKPIIGLGRGIFTFYGEIKDNYSNMSVGRIGTRLNITRAINSYLDLDFSVVQGKLTGNQQTATRNYNFQTEVLCGSVGVLYNFEHVLKIWDEKFPPSRKRFVFPYLGMGLESFNFSSKGDLKDANGNSYYYWSDGSMRNLPETDANGGQSVVLQRDYNYESDLRELDIDAFGKYATIAFALPIDFGVRMNVTERVSLRVGTTYHLSLNDKIDNITSKSVGERQGTKWKDGYMFTYVSLHFNLFNSHTTPPWEDTIYEVPEIAFDFGDLDDDGVNDLRDDCAGTEKDVIVGVNGCPLDTDRDGISQHIDDELETMAGKIVNLRGVTMLEDVPVDSIAILHKDLYVWYPSYRGEMEMYRGIMFIPDRWKPFDTDNDEYISFDEFNAVIDAWFDFKVDLTIEDIYELNEFFFSQ